MTFTRANLNGTRMSNSLQHPVFSGCFAGLDLFHVWVGTFCRKRRQTPQEMKKQCVGKNERFRTFFGSIVDHKRSPCFANCPTFLVCPTLFSPCFQLVILSILVSFLVFFCIMATSPLLSSSLLFSPALPCPHKHTHAQQTGVFRLFLECYESECQSEENSGGGLWRH